jgi:cell division protease FtsH
MSNSKDNSGNGIFDFLAADDDDQPADDANSGTGARHRPSVSVEMPRLALNQALGPALLRRFSGPAVAVVIAIPGPDWLRPVAHAVGSLPGQHFVCSRDGTSRTNHKPSVGNSEAGEALRIGHHVIGISHDPKRFLPSALMASADAHVDVKAPDAVQIRKILARCVGRPPRDIPDAVLSGLTYDEIVAAFRLGASPARVIWNLQAASRAKSRASASDTTPPLDQLPGYSGESLQWGLDLAQDIAAWRRGEIAWRDIASAAVLYGQPGTGKTLFARALARSCGLVFVSTSVGAWFSNSKGDLGDVIVTASASWDAARASRPCLYFLDEIDALPDRSKLDADRLSWWGPVVDFVLTIFDGAATDRSGIVLLAATNHPDKLDSALVRPGRLDRLLEVALPDASGLADIVAFHLDGALAAKDLLAATRLARNATGATAASWARGARRRARVEGRPVTVEDVFAEIAPTGNRSARDQRIAAVHEAGHAVTAVHTGRTLSSVSIVASGRSGGATAMAKDFPDFPSRADVENHVVMLLGGRAAEAAFCGCPSTSAEGDIAMASALLADLRASSGLGPDLVHRVSSGNAAALLGLDPVLRSEVADDLARIYARSVALVRKHRRAVEALADALEQRRFLDGAEATKIILGVPATGGRNTKRGRLQ